MSVAPDCGCAMMTTTADATSRGMIRSSLRNTASLAFAYRGFVLYQFAEPGGRLYVRADT